MRTVAIIQARMESERLPGKVLAEAAGKPLLVHMIERLKRCETLDDMVIASAGGEANAAIWDTALDNHCLVISFDIPDEDVLGRVLLAARWMKADVIVEITSDCPALDPGVVDHVVTAFREAPEVDFCSNTRDAKPVEAQLTRGSVGQGGARLGAAWKGSVRQGMGSFSRGQDVRVFPTSVLAEVDRLTSDPVDREHVSVYIWEHPERFRCRWVSAPPELADETRLTVDTPEDLELVRRIFEHFSPSNDFGLAKILRVLDEHPEWRAINENVRQKEVR